MPPIITFFLGKSTEGALVYFNESVSVALNYSSIIVFTFYCWVFNVGCNCFFGTCLRMRLKSGK